VAAVQPAAAPGADRAAVVPSLLLFRVRLAPVNGKPLGDETNDGSATVGFRA
jgi:hypothetical protein